MPKFRGSPPDSLYLRSPASRLDPQRFSQMPSTSSSSLNTRGPAPARRGHHRAKPKLSNSFLAAPGRRRQGLRPGHHPLILISNPPARVLELRNSWRLTRVKSGEAEGSPGMDGITLDEQTLQRDLERAIKEEDYSRAAKLRDDLRVLHEDSKSSVLAANARFYQAFRKGDLVAMHSIWAKDDNVYVIHPGAGRISGYDLVMGSWEMVCGADHEFPLLIDLKDVEVHVRDNIGYVTCMEVVKTRGNSWGKQVATNVFEKVDGRWFICIHHASHIEE